MARLFGHARRAQPGGPAQQAAEERGYLKELCSYARTHLGCAVNNQRSTPRPSTIVRKDSEAAKVWLPLPPPDMIISAYAYCSTGQQWDDMLSRLFGKQIPIFNVSIPWIWAAKKYAKYMRGQEWHEAPSILSGNCANA